MGDALGYSGSKVVRTGGSGTRDAAGIDPFGRPDVQMLRCQAPGERRAQSMRRSVCCARRYAAQVQLEPVDSQAAAGWRWRVHLAVLCEVTSEA
jgi:hypothetical protein